LGIDDPNLAAFEDYDVGTSEQRMLITETKIKLLQLNVHRFIGLYARAGMRRDAALTIGVLAPIALLIASLGFFLFRVRAPTPSPA
jgi:hypothetical protein